MKRQSQQGIALVITLILLSVITFMTVTFLVVSRHEGEQVDTTTQQNVARMGAEGIEQMAVAEIIANMLASTNGYANQGLIVSTNFISPSGYYDPALGGLLQNVSYNYQNGTPLSQADLLIMLTNLLYLPRAPVFVSTNKNQPNPEFRFYHDLNGNGKFDTNGLVMNQKSDGTPVTDINNNPTFSVQVGDPEWVGFLEHPDQRHSASNIFLSRGAFIAIPIGQALDANAIHNESRLSAPVMAANAPEGFYRNQGVTGGELNLAAFLAMLNPNVWNTNTGGVVYHYSSDPTAASTGTAFNDAASILQYRYGGSINNLNRFVNLFGPSAVNSYLLNGTVGAVGAVDAYAVGPLMTGVNPPPLPGVLASTYSGAPPWSGANNPVQLARPRDLLTMIPPLNTGSPLDSFTNRLYQIGLSLDTFNRYTYYRMLAQMGFSSAPEPAAYPIGGGSQFSWGPQLSLPIPANIPIGTSAGAGRNQMSSGAAPEAYPYVHSQRMNINYNNLGSNGVALTATNFAGWTPIQFFTNAADRLLRTYYPTNFAVIMDGRIVVTNININFIPIYPVNYYTPGVHRLLQLAANMYDATTNKSVPLPGLPIDYPSVFRPFFANATSAGGTNLVYIGGYTEQLQVPSGAIGTGSTFWNKPLDLRRPNDLAQLISDSTRGVYFDPTNAIDNVYGVPYVIGARTNLPNFNQFSMAPVVQITRQLQLVRTGTTLQTNVSYVIGVSNVMGVQCWNSSTNFQGRQVNIYFTNEFSMLVTNNFGAVPLSYPPQVMGSFSNILTWPAGYVNGQLVVSSFQPFSSNLVTISNFNVRLSPGAYSTNGTFWNPVTVSALTKTFFQPDWGVIITNNLRVIMTDARSGRILDCVQLGGLGQLPGLDSLDDAATNLYTLNFPNTNLNIWNPAPISVGNPMPIGFFNQFRISTTLIGGQPIVPAQFWDSAPNGAPGNNSSVTNAIWGFIKWLSGTTQGPTQVPYSPTVKYAKIYTWCANDPLVHYTVGDLNDLTLSATNAPQSLPVFAATNVLNKQLTGISSRYRPWGNTKGLATQMSAAVTADPLEFGDPLITQSQDWQFLTNKYPNVGWLGRVHRGTPWQTVYLKSHGLGYNQATFPTAWQYWTGNQDPVDAGVTQPVNDWALLDLFTTSPNDNASRGQLSVNQTNAAALAALLDGVIVLSNSPTKLVATNIDLNQANPANGNLVQYMVSGINSQRTNMPNGVFGSVAQLLATPQLTVSSPYINTANPNLSDAVYERIPQQIASLLRTGTPRYEIYAYGQALKPADKSIVQSGASFGMPTNYQITGEVLTRTVVRFDNMPVPGHPAPGTTTVYALPVQGQNAYVMVTNVVPPVRAVVESFTVLGPDQ